MFMFLKARLKPGLTHNKKEKELLCETALELTESRIWALDLENKGSRAHVNKSTVGTKETQSSLSPFQLLRWRGGGAAPCEP